MTYFRVYSGIIKSGSYVFNANTGNRERLGRILRMHANKREEIEEVFAGEIAAGVGLKAVKTGHSLTDEEHPIVLESMKFPEPVISVAIEPKSKADEEKMGIALNRWRKKIPRSVSAPITKRTKPSSPAWASCTWTFWWTA